MERDLRTDHTRIHTPEFREGLEWLHVARPPTLADLRGKIVLLDFWTYG